MADDEEPAPRRTLFFGLLSINPNQLDIVPRFIFFVIATLVVSAFVVSIQQSAISCDEHAEYDRDVCDVPLSTLFLAKGEHVASPPPPSVPSLNATLNATQTSTNASRRALARVWARQLNDTTNAPSAPITPNSTNVTAEPVEPATPPKIRVPVTFEGYTTPFYVLASFSMGALLQAVVSVGALGLYAFHKRELRLPRMKSIGTHTMWLCVANLARVVCWTLFAQLAPMTPSMYVSKIVGTPFSYAFTAIPLAWMSAQTALPAAQRWWQARKKARRAKKNGGVDESEGLKVDMDMETGEIRGTIFPKHELEGSKISNRAMFLAKWVIMSALSLLAFVIVVSNDEYLLFEPPFPYSWGIVAILAAASINTWADAVLAAVCETTRHQRKDAWRRFGSAAFASFIQSGFFFLFANLCMIGLEMPQLLAHGWGYTFPSYVGDDDHALLSGLSGTFVVAVLFALYGLAQIVTYKYVYGLSWVFIQTVALWSLIVLGDRRPDAVLASNILISIGCWILQNQLQTIMKGATKASSAFESGFTRLNLEDEDDEDAPSESDVQETELMNRRSSSNSNDRWRVTSPASASAVTKSSSSSSSSKKDKKDKKSKSNAAPVVPYDDETDGLSDGGDSFQTANFRSSISSGAPTGGRGSGGGGGFINNRL